jgi:copper oxidase (laccase) domain-containing protein
LGIHGRCGCADIAEPQAEGLRDSLDLFGGIVVADHACLGFGKELFLVLDCEAVVDVECCAAIVPCADFAAEHLPIETFSFVHNRAVAHEEPCAFGGIFLVAKAGHELRSGLVNEGEELVISQMAAIIEVRDANGQYAGERQSRRNRELQARHGGKDSKDLGFGRFPYFSGMYCSLQDLPADLPFRVGFSTMADGSMSYPLSLDHEVVFQNRARFFEKEGLPAERLVTFFTEHSDDITLMYDFPFGKNALRGERLAVTDAVISRVPGAGVFLTFADCVPFVVYDRRQHLMAFAHVGWRSMAMGFTGKVLRHLQDVEGSLVEDLIAVVGPCIKKDSYVYRDPVQAGDPVWKDFLVQRADGRVGIDLVGFCLSQCHGFGLDASQIYVEPMDTAADDAQFSHYMGTEGGRPEKQGRLVCYGYLG